MQNSSLQRLPLGRSAFSVIRKDGCLYVDKTELIYNLITQGYRYFLSRPRRFGKSLLISTLQEILEGNKELFEGLWIANSDYKWRKYGVIVLDFSTLDVTNIHSLQTSLCESLQTIATHYNLELTLHTENPNSAVLILIQALHTKFGHVAVLVDEYDSPILKNLEKTEKAQEIREAIRNFFAALKSPDKYIDFVFITGVSSFAKAGLFSGLNNLKIITLDERWATICGYTDQEIDHYFAPYMQAWSDKKNISYAELRVQIKDWYNGYRFGKNVESVYNPFSFMNALDSQEFENFWLQTGTPTFLIKEMEKSYRAGEHAMVNLELFEATANLLGTFDIGQTPLISLMFQAGYLTITRFDEEKRAYLLDYPNYEVRTAAQQYLLSVFLKTDSTQAEHFALKLWSALKEKNITEVVALIKSMFVRVAYQTHILEEKFYHSLLQVLFGAAGLKVYSELPTSHARIDMIVELSSVNYVIEVKFNQSAEKALKQIEDRKYYEVLQYQNKPIVLLGLNFHRKKKEFDITYVAKEI